jgi:hypothetical protein
MQVTAPTGVQTTAPGACVLEFGLSGSKSVGVHRVAPERKSQWMNISMPTGKPRRRTNRQGTTSSQMKQMSEV